MFDVYSDNKRKKEIDIDHIWTVKTKCFVYNMKPCMASMTDWDSIVIDSYVCKSLSTT